MISIKIPAWKKFNPRCDVSKSSWFRLENDLFGSPKFYNFSPQEMCVWIFILCLTSRHNGEPIEFSIEHAIMIGHFKRSDILSAITKLEENQSITTEKHVHDTSRTADDTSRTSTDGRTDDTDVFNFENLYQKYPRKVGKQLGIKKCRKEIRTKEDFDALVLAVEKFTAHHRQLRTESKFIPHFSSFMDYWRDWLDPNAGTSEDFSKEKTVVMN